MPLISKQTIAQWNAQQGQQQKTSKGEKIISNTRRPNKAQKLSVQKHAAIFGKPNKYSKPAPPELPPMMASQPRFTGYRTGLLNAVYNMLSGYGGMEGSTRDSFVKSCMDDPEINNILSNGYLDRLDEMGGLPKLALSLYSKYVQHRYIE